MMYLYVTESGSFWQSYKEPDEEDIRMINDGLISIFRFETDRSFCVACVGFNDDQILDIVAWEKVELE